MAPLLSCAELRVSVSRLPRAPLGHFPTPLDFCSRLTDALGGPRIFIKRDDCTGLAFGGNKVRQLEFTIAQGIRQGADILVGGATSQSNHARQLAAACAQHGVDCALVLMRDEKHTTIHGNLLIDELMGARIEFVDADSLEEVDDAQQDLVHNLRSEGRRPFVVTQPSTRHFGAMGYALCMAELHDQAARLGERIDTLVVCSASTTQPGLIFGNRLLDMGVRIIGVTPIHWSYDLKDAFQDVLQRMAETIELDVAFSADDIINLGSYVGPEGFGSCSPEGNEALNLLARTEGILLDPIYSAKSFAGLVDLVEKGEIGPDENVVFLHTGGTPTLFAYADELRG